MSYLGDIVKAIAPAIIGGGIGLINNNQAVQRAKGEANAIKAEQDRLLEIAKQNEINIKLMKAGKETPDKEKSNTALYIGLGVGGVVLLGIVIFAVTRSNKS